MLRWVGQQIDASRQIVSKRVSYYVCLSLTVVATCATNLVGAEWMQYRQSRHSAGKTKQQLVEVEDRVCLTRACEQSVCGQRANGDCAGRQRSVKQAIRENKSMFHCNVKHSAIALGRLVAARCWWQPPKQVAPKDVRSASMISSNRFACHTKAIMFCWNTPSSSAFRKSFEMDHILSCPLNW